MTTSARESPPAAAASMHQSPSLCPTHIFAAIDDVHLDALALLLAQHRLGGNHARGSNPFPLHDGGHRSKGPHCGRCIPAKAHRLALPMWRGRGREGEGKGRGRGGQGEGKGRGRGGQGEGKGRARGGQGEGKRRGRGGEGEEEGETTRGQEVRRGEEHREDKQTRTERGETPKDARRCGARRGKATPRQVTPGHARTHPNDLRRVSKRRD